jgi:hypothetical protein
MRQVHVQVADVRLDRGSDTRALGGAVTLALCGTWEHEPPCPLAAHHTGVTAIEDGRLHIRVVFACEPDAEEQVRTLIAGALAEGSQQTPEGELVRWRLTGYGAGELREDEVALGERLLRA